MTSEARAVLALNPGSSSLKAAVRDPTLRLAAHVERLGTDKARATISAPGAEPAWTPVSGDFDDAVAWAEQSPYPDPSTLLEDVYESR